MDVRTVNDMKPVDYLAYDSDSRDIFRDASQGIMPEIEQPSEVPIIPDYAIAGGEKKKKKKTGKKGKKGKKGGKKGKKKKKK